MRVCAGKGHYCGVSDGLEYLLERAPSDVRVAVGWLLDRGAVVTQQRGGATESFGNVLVRFDLPDAGVTVTRDRNQWMLTIQTGATQAFDLDLVCAGMTGQDRWSKADGALPEQLPEGVSWASELPKALAWVRATPDAQERLVALGRDRAKQRLGLTS